MENTRTENKMGYMPVPGLILKMSLPMMVSMLVLATYNIVDSIFVAKISEDALTAVSLVFPYQMLITAVAVGTGVGVNSLVARRLGEKRQEEANLAASNGMFLSLVGGVAFLLFFALLTPLLLKLYNPTPEIYDYARTYMYLIGIPAIFPIVEVMTEKTLQATGSTTQSMLIQLSGAVFNLIFDPILIFGLFGFPRLGVAGAAIATVLGQTVGMLLGLYFILRKSCLVQIRLKALKPQKRVIADIYQVGVPSIFLQIMGSILNFGMNKILIGFTPTAVSVLGVYFKLQSFVFMPVFGLNSGTMPIMGFNFGARNKRRIMDALKYGALYAFGIMTLGFAFFQFAAPWMLSLFDASPEMLEIGVPALRIISVCFPAAALSIMGSSLFQAIGNGRLSLFVSMLRQLIIMFPVAYAFSKLFGLHAVWYAFPIAEAVSLVVVAGLVYKVYKQTIAPLGD